MEVANVSELSQRLEALKEKIADQTFLNREGLGNEIAFYIFDYDASAEPLVQAFVSETLVAKSAINIIEINLYGLVFEVLTKRGSDFLQKAFDLEKDKGNKALEKALGRMLSPDKLIALIEEKLTEAHDLVFLTGVGAVWPLLRSHSILNNLHPIIDKVPLVMFYPGSYSGKDLRLFDEFSDDNYYRAFQLIPRTPLSTTTA